MSNEWIIFYFYFNSLIEVINILLPSRSKITVRGASRREIIFSSRIREASRREGAFAERLSSTRYANAEKAHSRSVCLRHATRTQRRRKIIGNLRPGRE